MYVAFSKLWLISVAGYVCLSQTPKDGLSRGKGHYYIKCMSLCIEQNPEI